VNAYADFPQLAASGHPGLGGSRSQRYSRIRRVVVATELITTVAGTGASGFNGGDIAPVGAQLPEPSVVTA